MRRTAHSPALILLATLAGLGCKSTTEPSLPAGDVRIVLNASTLGSAAFSPGNFSESIATRAAVIWVNGDRTSGGYGGSTGTTHRLVSNTGVFDSGNIAPGRSYTFTFAAAGTYTYHCSIHPGMVGTITITP
jgi:hypothetical protein